MFCHNCGKKLPDGLNFCTACGTKLIVPTAPAEKVAPAEPERPLAQHQSLPLTRVDSPVIGGNVREADKGGAGPAGLPPKAAEG